MHGSGVVCPCLLDAARLDSTRAEVTRVDAGGKNPPRASQLHLLLSLNNQGPPPQTPAASALSEAGARHQRWEGGRGGRETRLEASLGNFGRPRAAQEVQARQRTHGFSRRIRFPRLTRSAFDRD